MSGFADSIEAFHAAAREACQLEDFGEDDYRHALGVLCRSLDEDAQLTPAGGFALQAMITDALSARLLTEAGWQQFPEVAEARIERPIFIIGLPRTGTTALHHLIAQDPSIQALEHWLHRTPKPRPPRSAWSDDPDFQAAAARVDLMFERSPEMRAIHEIEADLPDECWNTFAQNFLHSSYQANADVSQYAAWWVQQDMRPVYRRHRRTAQLVGHREPGKRWLFKDATHLFDLDALIATYPDARIVQTHRDPVDLIPSVCSLCWSARSALNENPNAEDFGRATLALWQGSILGMMQTREKYDPDQFFDLPFNEFVADPIASIRAIYEAFELDFTPGAETAMRTFREAHPRGQHGAHDYSLDQWGLSADSIADAFRPYSDRYGVNPSRFSA